MNNKVLIVGFGNVGQNLYKELNRLKVGHYDINPDEYENKPIKNPSIVFICVDTPYEDEDNPCDISAVKDALSEHEAEIYVIKSTVLPGTTEQLKKETGKHIVFSPEYYGTTQHCNNFEFNFTILGGDKEDCLKVQQVLQNNYDARHKFYIVDSKTAELAKYMENAWIATKVSFCNQFFDIAENIGVDYETLRELFIADPRVNPSHTFVYRDHPYWDSHCLNKDVPAIAETQDAELLKDVIDYNYKRKRGNS